MTADIRTAAQREASRRWPDLEIRSSTYRRMEALSKHEFTEGALWAANRVTPTRDQLIERIAGNYFAEHMPGVGEHTEVSVPLATSIADLVIDLMQELAEGEQQ